MRKEPFDQFVRARGTETICKVEGPAGNGSNTVYRSLMGVRFNGIGLHPKIWGLFH